MGKKSAEDYLDKLLNSVNDEKAKKDKFKQTAKMLEDAMSFWDADIPNSELESAEYDQMVADEGNHSGQEDLLDALLSNAKETEAAINKQRADENAMYSRRVSKSEADYLKEFEAELAEDGENLDDLFAEFEKEMEPEDKLEPEDIYPIESVESYILGDVDLAEIVSESTSDASEEETFSLNDFAMASEPIPMDEIPESMFDELFGEADSLDLTELPQEMPTEEEGLDLGNLGDEDLMNLLAGAEGLEDIGNMLNKGEITEISEEEMDAFTTFADNEMSAQQISADAVVDAEDGSKKKRKKGNFGEKIKGFIGFLLKSEEDELELKKAAAPTVEVLTDENADILAELDKLEEMPSKKGKDKKKKDKKEKKKKEKKPKEPKEPKKVKLPKPKKEKKPKEVDNTPPLPRGPVIMIWVMVGSLMALVLLGIDMISYNSSLSTAKNLQNKGHYAEAFTELNGLKIKEKDLELYSQLAILATVDSELNAYEVFSKAEVEDKAFDSLICAAGRSYMNKEDAEDYGCLGQLELLKKTVTNELQEKYNMTYEEAIDLYTIRFRDNYTVALYKKLTELGIKWE